MKEYNHSKIEKKWQREWEKKKIYKTEDAGNPSTDSGRLRRKMYVLDMFPYPSGEGLHVGHPRGYIATDVYSRMKKMQGYNVLHPMGWDAFGLPAENFAIKNKVHPEVAVEKNVKRFKEQLSLIGFNYDWSREINTTDPEYYKWTQWIFLQMYKKGLAYESYEPINWCPSCQTGLANEDVENDGTCERCGTKVEKRPMRQWVLKITDYADRMLADLDKLPNWPDGVKEAQRNWIGKSEGAEIMFGDIKVFTTRADTIFGATFVAIPGEKDKFTGKYAINPATKEKIPVWEAEYVMRDYGTGAIMGVPAHDERDFEFAKKHDLPIRRVVEPKFFADKGEGAVRLELPFVKREAVCAIVRNPKDDSYLCISWKGEHKMNGLVTGGIDKDENKIKAAKREIMEETGYKNLKLVKDSDITINTFFYHRVKKENRHAHFHFVFFDLENEEKNSVDEKEASLHEVIWKKKEELKNFLSVFEGYFVQELLNNPDYIFIGEGTISSSGKFNGMESGEARKKITKELGGKVVTKYKLRDWVFSRQRYWGEPIPIIHCSKCGVVPVPEKDLPVVLPKVKSYEPTGTGESPLADISKWVNVKCPKCGGKGKRETNTMPQWAGSSWYYLRYIDPKNPKALVGSGKEKNWMPVDVYVGGDHATRHLIYARFWHKFLYDIGVVSTEEPFPRLEFLGFILAPDGRKMSKRWKNVINPDDMVERFGADAFRLYEMFIGPFENTVPWSTDGLVGTRRFIERVWKIYASQSEISSRLTLPPLPAGTHTTKKSHFASLEKILHKTIKKVTEDIENFKFNTAVSAMMIFSNEMEKEKEISKDDFKMFLQILAPFAPHIAEELWCELGEKNSIHLSTWPSWDPKLIVDEEVKIMIQVNGKVRGEVLTSTDTLEEEIKQKALSQESVKKYTEGKNIKKIIYVKGRLINIVV